MRIEAVTVCVNYSDFLAQVESLNRVHLSRWLIVTSPADEETRELCRLRNLECLVTDDFTRDGAAFDKAKGVDRALMHLTHVDWLLHLDADIVLPPHFLESLQDADLDPKCIYGFDRFTVAGWERWQKLQDSGFLARYSRGGHHYVCFPEGYPVGARWADPIQGYVPVGFAQLWHSSATMRKGVRWRRYAPFGHNDAARTDVQFALQWDRRQRILIPEVVVAHLESDGRPPVGANWNGRTTAPFGAAHPKPHPHPCPCPVPPS